MVSTRLWGTEATSLEHLVLVLLFRMDNSMGFKGGTPRRERVSSRSVAINSSRTPRISSINRKLRVKVARARQEKVMLSKRKITI